MPARNRSTSRFAGFALSHAGEAASRYRVAGLVDGKVHMRGHSTKAARSHMRWWIASSVALAASALGAAALAGTAQAAYPGSDGLIAFVRGGNIYTIDPQAATPASTIVKLTHDGHDSGPRWSPKGTRLAYLDRGNLWIMDANGSHKTQITSQAPAYTDARPTWSPNGRYLAFVKTKKGASDGYLTRYDTVTHKFATFTTSVNGHQARVTALPAAVAWARALNAANQPGYFIIFEGATQPACPSGEYCLNALGFSAQSDHRNGFPSSEDATASPVRLLDPDWSPNSPSFDVNALTTQESCSASHCTHTGIDLTIGASPTLPGGYEAVYSPSGAYIAYVKTMRGKPEIYIYAPTAIVLLTHGSQPDWQPVPAAS
jgi:Dipeptidyl peptidase IV (DPP IV) N-terminal region